MPVDPIVIVSSSSSMGDSTEHTDLVVTECAESRLERSLTRLHQLCRESRTLWGIKAFLNFEPICKFKRH